MRRPLALVALLAIGGCRSNPEEETPRQATEPRRDLDALRRYLTLPAGVGRAEWIVAPRGIASTAPGPTDLMLLTRFPLDAAAYDALRPTLGPSRGEQRVPINRGGGPPSAARRR